VQTVLPEADVTVHAEPLPDAPRAQA